MMVLPSPRLHAWPASGYPAAIPEDLDIYRAARLLIDKHGDEAAIRATALKFCLHVA
jgi:hypothetical protein